MGASLPSINDVHLEPDVYREQVVSASSNLQNLEAAPIATFQFSSVNTYCPLLDARPHARHQGYKEKWDMASTLTELTI